MQPFLAQSPPAYAHQSPIATFSQNGPTPLGPTIPNERPRLNSTTSGMDTMRSPHSTIAILPSSLPDFHVAFMKGRPIPEEASLEKQSTDERNATARRFKPHSRSQLALEKVYRPEGLTPIPAASKKARPTKWQFGIRSRNQPAEAMLAIYKALKAMGAEWEAPPPRKPEHGRGINEPSPENSRRSGSSADEGSFERNNDDHHHREHYSSDGSDSNSDPSPEHRRLHHDTGRTSASQRGRGRRARHGEWDDWGYSIPADPWIINARFRKHGMYPPGVMHPYNSSANSSRADLTTLPDEVSTSSAALNDSSRPAQRRTGSSTHSSAGSTASLNNNDDNPSISGPSAASLAKSHPSHPHMLPGADLSAEYPTADDSAWVYMTIQLYSIEKEFYLVDFKCAGYERLVRHLVREMSSTRKEDERAEKGRAYDDEEEDDDSDDENSSEHEELVGDGRATWEKKVSSPFPFLDVASRLIIQLAEAE